METLYKFYNSKNKFFTISSLQNNEKADLFCEFLSLSNNGEKFHYKALADNESSESVEFFIPELSEDKDFDEIWEEDNVFCQHGGRFETCPVCNPNCKNPEW